MDNTPKDKLVEMSQKVDAYNTQIDKILAAEKLKIEKLKKQKRAIESKINAEKRKRRTHAMIEIGSAINAIYTGANNADDIVDPKAISQLIAKLKNDKYIVDIITHFDNQNYVASHLNAEKPLASHLNEYDQSFLTVGRIILNQIGGVPDWAKLVLFAEENGDALRRLKKDNTNRE